MTRPGARAWLALLSAQRWFGARGRVVAGAELRASAPVDCTPAGCELACVQVRFADGEQVTYQAPFAPDGGENLRDALTLPGFRAALARAFAEQRTIAGVDGRWRFEAIGDLAALADAPSRVASGEQSNTSIVIGDRWIFKVFRRVEPGDHPDVEIGRFLTSRADFGGTPALRGVLHLHTAAGTCVAGMVQDFLPGAVDGWNHVLASLAASGEPSARLLAELTALGAVTRELHAALASDAAVADPAFAPEPTRAADLARWRAATRAQIATSLTRLGERQASLPATLQPAISQLLAQRDRLLAALTEGALDVSNVGPRSRHHGDYHLGQVLKAGSDWRIIDFEGEPTRPLAERRAKHHPLRDVAGMLRSFAYAAAVAAPDRSAAVARTLQAAFLAGYDPEDTMIKDTGRAGLLALFTAEKLFYELAYELGNRPDWAWIPLSAAPDLLPARTQR